MTDAAKPTPEAIRQARADNPKMRERDLAQQLQISEADLVASYCGLNVIRISPRIETFLTEIEALGEVMALTRNESAVHEKIGIYDKPIVGKHACMMLGEQIDMRLFPNSWAHGFAVEKQDGEDIRRSMQFFDAAGEAIHKIHLRPNSNVEAYHSLVAKLRLDDQSQSVELTPLAKPEEKTLELEKLDAAALRDRWTQMKDVHEFFGILRSFNMTRHQAVQVIGQDFAWQLDTGALITMMHDAAQAQLPIMCFVGNRGCIQIHSGPIQNVKPMGPWINILDETFHMHLRTDHIAELWAVRKPTKDGHVTSLEAYGGEGEMIIQFFGKRHEGSGERQDWRQLVEALPRLMREAA
ncbi:hemin-degrading factor [Phyllobacterium endophyticum]|uniref:Hemin-degrading factor n=1 Tax=Phyllobacterium endophyticum TaxID=1149773 RepID=A0A2P7ARL4_9HYPH|nr:ChuX/HutX family heme-like substrate-binding protein [Phyllobacterium endophyticum]MBB3236525.1 putative hemin transport protein [Phyllobacterium endophyticum]PSH56858.1 hemin-degrading factor [Phyllobacterium endophyticum]TYR39533.1 hemin-degrading factor [Phyllobacterium endophyticum]